MAFDYGQNEITAFRNAIDSPGHLTFDPDAVREVVRLYDLLIAQLTTERDRIKNAEHTEGFGVLQSGRELADGFAQKATDAYTTCGEFIEGALRLQEAYLLAAGLYEDADQKNAAAITIAAESLDNETIAQ